ncbi:MAG: histidine kinase [Gorillibacterium sp.]|nr:histidine kinase [Gorillibacterium sp.]
MRITEFYTFFRRTFRGRIIVMLLISSLLPLTILGGVSYYSINSLLVNKIEKGFMETLEKERINVENTLNNLNFTSQQLSLNGRVVKLIERYLELNDDPLSQRDIQVEINTTMSLINFTNPNIGIILIMRTDTGEVLFRNYPVRQPLNLQDVPILSERRGLKYYAPHATYNPFGSSNSKELSFSILRQTESDNGIPIQVYVETNYALFPRLLSSMQYGRPVVHLLTNNENRITYTEDAEHFPLGTLLPPNTTGMKSTAYQDQMLFPSKGSGEWTMYVAIGKGDYHYELRQWLKNFWFVALFNLVLSLLIAYQVWRIVYRPIQVFRKEINAVANNLPIAKESYMNLLEFDELLFRFYRMRQRIGDLVVEVEEKEKNKRLLEIEKLMYQINPHFIHNTLNTVQVLAKMSGQEDLVKLVAHFTRILHYNLGKEGLMVTVKQEIENLKDYVALQQIRYDSHFNVSIDVDPETEDCQIPRFLLQPLVENAMYHGFRNKDGTIFVSVKPNNQGLMHVVVRDDGDGMTKQELDQLLEGNGNPGKAGLGIGLKFVSNIIRAEYGEIYSLKVESILGQGTSLSFHIPMEKGGEAIDPDASR